MTVIGEFYIQRIRPFTQEERQRLGDIWADHCFMIDLVSETDAPRLSVPCADDTPPMYLDQRVEARLIPRKPKP